MTSARRKKDGHRSIPKRYSSARVHGTIQRWHRRKRNATVPSIRDWPEIEFHDPPNSLIE